MATRSTIVLKVRKEDIGKTLKFNSTKLPHGKTYTNEFPFGEVTIKGEYMEIYHHWDGYIEGVGHTLLTEFGDYDSVLNLLLMGDMSSINGNEVVSYHGWRNEDVPPRFYDEEPKVKEEYKYVFKDGEWYVTEADFFTDRKIDVLVRDCKELEDEI